MNISQTARERHGIFDERIHQERVKASDKGHVLVRQFSGRKSQLPVMFDTYHSRSNKTKMKITIQTPQVTARESLLDFVRQKVEKLAVFTDRLAEARVTLKLNKSDIRENKICEITGLIPGNDLFASKQAGSFEEATMDAVDAIKRQISDWKGKVSAPAGNLSI